MKADIVVVAQGPAGLAAAITAAQEGATVIAFEKGSTTGGTANMGMGMFAVESRVQRESLIALTKEEAFERFMDYTHWQVDARLVRDYFWKSASTIDWLMDMGVEFADVRKYYPGSEATWHVVKPQGGGRPTIGCASAMIKIMTERARELGVDIHLQTPATKIRKDNGRITGVLAQDRNGVTIEAEAKAVVIATGGFGDSPEWIKKYAGHEWGKDMFNFRVPGLVGDGIRMAWEAGAGRGNIDLEKTTLAVALPPELVEVQAPFRQPNLIVNLQGERFINEAICENGAVLANAVKRQQGRMAFAILDDSALNHYRKHGLDYSILTFLTDDPLPHFDEQIKAAVSVAPDLVFIAGSVEELAEKTGIDSATLRATVDQYNRCCEQNYDDLFVKPRRYLRPLKGPQYYAHKIQLGAYGSLGGIKINYKTEVVTDDWVPIPGLFAAGSDVCDIYAGTYLYYLPGNTMGFALNTGRIAGENAVKYVNLLD